MNIIFFTLLFFVDLFLANLFNQFFISFLLISAAFFFNEKEFSLWAPLFLSLELFIEFNNLFLAPFLFLSYLKIWPIIKENFSHRLVYLIALIFSYFSLKFVMLLTSNPLKISFLFTFWQLFVNLILIVSIFLFMENKGRLGNRFYRW